MGKSMKKCEWLNILAYYKKMFQLDHLPDTEYTAAMYDELRNYDTRFVAYAVNQIVRTDTTSFNRYPLLAQIMQNMPDFSYEKRELMDKSDRLKQLIAEKYPTGHPFNEFNRKEIRRLSYDLFGSIKDGITTQEIDRAVERKFNDVIECFFNTSTTKQLTNIKDVK